MSAPSLMVLYSNDSVEVRYSDGSRLQLSPCGSSVLHHDRPRSGTHPLAGLKRLQQRCRFVTSEYRHKVLPALDFRNRFADRAYLCEDLLIKEDVVSLYADIKEVAWPKSVDKARTEFLPDGSIRIFSSDEFASLSLSPHRRDFTVCYLSKISQELPKESKSSSKRSTSLRKSYSKERSSHNDSGDSSDGTLAKDGSARGTSIKHGQSTHDQSNDSTRQSSNEQFSHNQSKDDKSTLAKGLANSEIKDITSDVHQAQRNLGHKYTRISTPTNFADDGETGADHIVTPIGHSAAFRRYGGVCSTEVSPASHEISSISKTSSDGLCTTLDVDVTVGHDMSLQQRSASPILPNSNLSGQSNDSGSNGTCQSSKSLNGNSSIESHKGSANNSGSSPACQHLYTWVTRHISCTECPSSWSQALKLAVEKANIGPTETEQRSGSPSTPVERLKAPVSINKKTSVMSVLPPPLPLTCPNQHCHRWAHTCNEGEEEEEFTTGRIHVVMVEGMIYRLIYLPALKVLELYPGDGTVFVSQGVTGQFFSQIIPKQDKLEERTYSVRALPPSVPSAKYALDRMLKRASRFLSEAVQRDKLSLKEDRPCWKIEPVSVQEPMSVSVLEEAYIPNVGRFTAHTNGRVRAVFDDRTSLDMVCDFSARLEQCANHSAGDADETVQFHQANLSRVTALDREIDLDTCKLLLPSGKYVLVNKLKPGTYHKYVSQALEWSSWVNASPLERKRFYEKLGQGVNAQGSAALELQKINCFNYIIENTVLSSNPMGGHASKPRNSTKSVSSSAFHRVEQSNKCVPSFHGPNVSSHFYPINDFGNTHIQPMAGQVSTHCHSEPIRSSIPSFSQSSVLSNQNLGRHCYHDNQMSPWEPGRTRTMEMLEGFSSVRNALLQTNKLIQDIDHMLDKKS